MKVFTHPVVLALGTSTFYLLVLIAPLISPSHTAIYHFSGEPIVVFAPVLLYVFVFWLLLTGLFQWARNPGWPYLILWSILILSFPWRLLKNLFSLADRPLPHLLSIAAFLVPLFALIAIVIFRRPHVLPWFERTRHFVATILGFASLTGLVFLGQLLWFGWQARSLNHPRPLHSRHLATPAQTPKTRIIWILLDELSYQQVYEQRYPGLALPAFDQLAAQSTVFTQVVPAGIYTERVLPSLISGMPVDRTYSSSSGQLSLHNSSTNEWQSFDQHQTVFQDALNDGYSTAIAGWYNPYCRIMPQVLDQCFWTFNSANLGGMAPSQSITENLLEPLRSERTSILTLINRLHQLHASDIQSFRLHKQDYDEIFAAADHLLGDRSANFILLHLPIPHPEAIYNRRTSTFTASNSSYIDSLALADRYLAHVRTILQQRGEWDSSAIVIMGDHSWRTKLMWSTGSAWTPEDQAASHGVQFDDRPAYIVKMPYQQQSIRISDRFDAVRTRALLDSILDHQLRSSDDLSAWARQQSEAQPVSSKAGL
jgi:hypothetical protein